MLPISVCRFARRRSCPGVSPQRFDSPWYARSLFRKVMAYFAGGSYSRRTAIQLSRCKAPHLYGMGRPFCSGVFWKFLFSPSLVRTGKPALGGISERFFTLPLVRTEIPVFFGCFEKFLPLYLFPLGKAVLGVF